MLDVMTGVWYWIAFHCISTANKVEAKLDHDQNNTVLCTVQYSGLNNTVVLF